jgi:uncharacterized RDD family membrane protein YckC
MMDATEITASPSPLASAKPEQRVARISDRVFAIFLDAFVLLPGFCATVALSARWNHIPRSEDGSINLVGGPALVAMLLSILIASTYSFLLEGFCGATLGKEVMGIYVLRADHAPCGFGRAFLRNLLRPIDAIGFYLLGFIVAISSKQNQRIGDKVAGTIVAENPKARRWQAFLLLVAIAVIGIYISSLIIK